MAVTTSPARTDGLPALPGVEHRWLEVRSGGGRVRLHVAEAGSGAPVLLLHGWPQHWWCWRRVIERLGGHYRLLVPDLRGFGWSEAPGPCSALGRIDGRPRGAGRVTRSSGGIALPSVRVDGSTAM